ncbi:cytochrome c biogenesis protein, putative, Ccb2 [Galdieria sulphuraria]|uniref:Cytochrome c biogenesis protein, putative, Ccb2 n=1 Tax=Galdieria sulphuraria TaxID=130081 RepID=M2W0Z9_GALSU|nr:cytochrome c biogenesis protein, putative, Ccb2 [Galdieria sulphuraria]EME29291.1 cytochrome c biogenesis protein, putative, Ccb2 [Galdieria sulphuraria]|eukprot:XP_005705811.1 cytochrome c biogenesis protein, putative, Ccb2 [Galdieria sulphuraria]
MESGFVHNPFFRKLSLFVCSRSTETCKTVSRPNFGTSLHLRSPCFFNQESKSSCGNNKGFLCLGGERNNQQLADGDGVTVGIATCILFSIVVNRLFTSELTISQERADLLGVIFSVLSLVHVLWRQDFKTKEGEVETLVGKDYREINVFLNHQSLLKLEHLCRWIQEVTCAKSIVIQNDDLTLVRLGPGQEGQTVALGELAKQCLTSGEASFLADLNIVAGRNEFNYMPSNCKSIYMEPLTENILLILGCGKVRPFTEVDLIWIRSIKVQLVDLFSNIEVSICFH